MFRATARASYDHPWEDRLDVSIVANTPMR
jgi:hypothetical protein